MAKQDTRSREKRGSQRAEWDRVRCDAPLLANNGRSDVE